MKILFICHGNVGRSQMAEAFYNHLTKTKNASSAGIDKTTPEKFGHPNKEVVDAMMEEGVNVSRQRVKTVTKDMIRKADKIIILRTDESFPEYVLNSKKAITWCIEDPYKMSLMNVRKVRNKIKIKILSII